MSIRSPGCQGHENRQSPSLGPPVSERHHVCVRIVRGAVYSPADAVCEIYEFERLFDKRVADVVIITKSDLLPHVDFSIDRCLGNVRAVKRSIRSFVLSATTGEGVSAWCDWLNAEQSAAVQASV